MAFARLIVYLSSSKRFWGIRKKKKVRNFDFIKGGNGEVECSTNREQGLYLKYGDRDMSVRGNQLGIDKH